jgi:hypothetical protein
LGEGSGWIVDQASKCGTSNPFGKPNETIRWFGACQDGRITGRGTLVWYENGVESERNEGTFQRGELHGAAITSYPDGQVVVGSYSNGIRDGDFVIVRADGTHIRAKYDRGALLGEAPMSTAEVDVWRRERTIAAGGTLAQAIMTPPQAAATTRAANERLVAAKPLSSEQRASLAAAPPSTPTVQLARGESVAPLPAAPVVAAIPAPLRPAEAIADPRTDRTAHIGDALAPGQTVRMAAATPSPTPAVPIPTVDTIAPVATAVGRSPAPAFAPTTIAHQFAGRDGPWVVAASSPAPLSQPAVAAPRVSEPVRLTAPRAESRDIATQFAGRDGPWVIGGSGRPAVEAVPRFSSPQIASPAIFGASTPNVVAPPSSRSTPRLEGAPPAVAAPGLGEPELLFQQSYDLELSGRYFEAEEGYRRILGSYASAPAARLAAARLDALRGRSAVAVAPPRADVGPSGMVVAVNSPRPVAPVPSQGTAANPGMMLQSPLINRLVCTQEGIYQQAARWCGLVTFDEGDFLQVEVRDLRLGGFGQIGISRSPCSGNMFLTWFSRGASVRVPKQCMTLVS